MGGTLGREGHLQIHKYRDWGERGIITTCTHTQQLHIQHTGIFSMYYGGRRVGKEYWGKGERWVLIRGEG